MIQNQFAEARAGGVAVNKWWFLPCLTCSCLYLDHTATSKPFAGLSSDRMAEILADKHARQLVLQSSNRTLTGRLNHIPHTPTIQRTLSFASSPVASSSTHSLPLSIGRLVVPLRPRVSIDKTREVSSGQDDVVINERELVAPLPSPSNPTASPNPQLTSSASGASSGSGSRRPRSSELLEEKLKGQKRSKRDEEVEVREEEEDDRIEDEEDIDYNPSDESEEDIDVDERSDEDYSDDLSDDSPLSSSED